jgi:hypothetical protein
LNSALFSYKNTNIRTQFIIDNKVGSKDPQPSAASALNVSWNNQFRAKPHDQFQAQLSRERQQYYWK